MTYDQNKRCPRCQQMGPAFKLLKLEACLHCNYPDADPRYDSFAEARARTLEATNKRRI